MKNTKKLKEFILFWSRTASLSRRPLIGILLGLLAGAGLIALEVNPLDAYAALLKRL